MTEPNVTDRRPPRLPWESVAAIAGALCLLFTMTVVANITRRTAPLELTTGQLLLGILGVQGVMIGAVLGVVWWRLPARRRWEALGFHGVRPDDVFIGLAAGPVLLLVVAGVALVALPVFEALGIEPQADPFLRLFRETPSGGRLLVLLAGALFAAPLAEELYFRQVVFRACRRYLGTITAALVASGIFAVMHGRVTAIPSLLALGLLLQYLRYWRGGLAVAIFAHMSFNCGALILASLLPVSPAG